MAFCHKQHLALLQGVHYSFALECIFETKTNKTQNPKQAEFIEKQTKQNKITRTRSNLPYIA
jgi:hypothetical protein